MNALRPYAQLVRLPNLPTAWADIFLAALVTGALPARLPALLVLLLASTCLYWSGMVFNDWFDVEQDKKERPFRPIPSGQVSVRTAFVLGAGLMVGGIFFAFLAGWVLFQQDQAPGWMRPGILSLLLASAILAYDGWLKRTGVGPVAMGLCRFLNVLLGVSISGGSAWPLGTHLALVVGLYIVGLTWLARTEARQSRQGSLLGAGVVLLGSLVLALPLAAYDPPERSSFLFPYLLVALGFAVGIPVIAAINSPTPATVQEAVKRALMSLIVLDAVLASSRAGTWGLVLLVLLVPSIYLNRRRWLYAT